MDDGFENGLSCPICYEHYEKGPPKALPCLHTFCMKCLLDLSEGQGFKTITCPLCNTVHHLPPNGVEGFNTNYALDDVVRDLHSPKFREMMMKKNKAEEVDAIVKREVKNLQHLVDVVHSPLLLSINSMKKGAVQQKQEKIKIVSNVYDRIIAHAQKEKEKCIGVVQRNTDNSMKYFDEVLTEILKEKRGIDSFCSRAERKTYHELESMDLKTFLVDATQHNRAGRRMATEFSHLMWTDVGVSEGKEQVRMVHSSLGSIVRVSNNKRSHRPRIGTMENGRHLGRLSRSKSEPNPDAIEAACLPKVDKKKLSDPVRSVVDSVLQKFNSNKRNNSMNKENGERRMVTVSETTPIRPQPMSPPATSRKTLFPAEPPPYSNRRMKRSKSEEEPFMPQNTALTNGSPPRNAKVLTNGSPQHTIRSKSSSSDVSHSSGSIHSPRKPLRSPQTPKLQEPCGIAMTVDENLVIADRGSGLILITHPRSMRVQRDIRPLRGHIDEAKVHALFDLTVLPKGDVAVTDTSLKKVIYLQKFNNYAAPQHIWMPHDMVPRGITSDESCMYICDAGNGCVQVYTHTGKHCSSIELDNLPTDRSPSISGACPQSIAVSPNGNILVTDIINRCLYLVLRSGEISRHPMRFTRNNGIISSTASSEAVPRGVCWLDDTRAFIVEDLSQEILVINAMNMSLLQVIRRREFSSLQGMVLDAARQLLVTDRGTCMMHVIKKDEFTPRLREWEPPKRSKSLSREEMLDTLV